MRLASSLLALAAAGFLAGCTEKDCTQEIAIQKATDLTTRIEALATSDPAKVAGIAPRLQGLSRMIAGGDDDLTATCKALDEMLAELVK